MRKGVRDFSLKQLFWGGLEFVRLQFFFLDYKLYSSLSANLKISESRYIALFLFTASIKKLLCFTFFF